MPNTTVSSEVLSLQLASQIIFSYGGFILIFLGTIGNLLNILVFIRLKTLRQMPNSIFLLTSFVTSLIQLWTARFSRATLSLTGIDLLALSPIYCQVRWLVGRMSSNITLASVCLSSIDRYLATSRNVYYRHIFTIQRACFIIVAMVFIYSVPFIPDSIYYTGPSCTAPGEPYAYRQFIIYHNTVIMSSLPVCILAVFGTLTWRNLRSMRLFRRTGLDVQVNRMMFGEFGMVCFTTIPTVVMNIYSQATQSMKKSQLRTAQDNLWTNVFNIINIATYCSSFYIFCAVSSSYRQNVRTVLCCKKQNRIGIQHHQLHHAATNRIIPNTSRL